MNLYFALICVSVSSCVGSALLPPPPSLTSLATVPAVTSTEPVPASQDVVAATPAAVVTAEVPAAVVPASTEVPVVAVSIPSTPATEPTISAAPSDAPAPAIQAVSASPAPSVPAAAADSAAPINAPPIGDKASIDKADECQKQAREAFDAIEKSKEERQDAYLAFDTELNGVYDSIGVVRGNASQDLDELKQLLVDTASLKTGSDAAASQLLKEQTTLLESVETSLKTLQEGEAHLIKALKDFSDEVLALGDCIVDIQSKTLEISTSENVAAAAALLVKVQDDTKKIVAASQEVKSASGSIKKIDDALAKAKESLTALHKVSDELKKKDGDLVAALKKLQERKAAQEKEKKVVLSVSPEDVEGENSEEDDKKKSEPTAPSAAMKMVEGTVFEAPYAVLADTADMVWDALYPVRVAAGNIYSLVAEQVSEVMDPQGVKGSDVLLDEEPLADPVLERIRLERHESKKRVGELAQQREVIEMKEVLLDRLEAERVMQLDKKQDLAAEISRAYARHDRELSWLDLCKRIFWKIYAAARRTTVSLVAWVRGEEPAKKAPKKVIVVSSDGVGVEKKEEDLGFVLK